MASSYNELMGLGSHAPDASLLAWYPMLDNAASTTVLDYSGNNRHGTAARNTSLTSAAGPSGWLTTCWQANGTSDKIKLPSATAVTGSNPRSYLMRVKVGAFDLGINRPLGSTATAATSGASWTTHAEDGAISLAMGNSRRITPKSALSTGTWYGLSFRVPAGATTTGQAKVGIDGTDQTLSYEGGASVALNTDAPGAYEPLIGAYGSSLTPTAFGNHAHSEFAALSRELSDPEQSNWLAGPELICSSAPTLSGTETQGQTLTCTDGTWGLDAPFAGFSNGTPTYSRQWTRSNDGAGAGEANISGATGSTYTLQPADVGKFVRCIVRATNDGGYDAAADTPSGFTGAIAAAGGSSALFRRGRGRRIGSRGVA